MLDQIEDKIMIRKFARIARECRRLSQSSRLLQASHDADEHAMIAAQDTNRLFFSAGSHSGLVLSSFLDARLNRNQTTLTREINILACRDAWIKWMERECADSTIVEQDSTSGYIIGKNDVSLMIYRTNNNSATLCMYGDEDTVQTFIDKVEGEFDVVTSHIEWVYSADGSSVHIPLSRMNVPVEEMYPFLNGESLADYYDRYTRSNSNILLLIGPPGTGKTTFIRGLLDHTKSSALVTYDTNILDKDYVFAQFMEGGSSIMVLEDSDVFLKTRSDGNSMMHRFLNVGDGLVTTKNKKMIFSTNLPSIRDIDPALIRPGRCFDILTFRELTSEEAHILADKVGVHLDSEKQSWSVAEIFNQRKVSSPVRSVGFV